MEEWLLADDDWGNLIEKGSVTKSKLVIILMFISIFAIIIIGFWVMINDYDSGTLSSNVYIIVWILLSIVMTIYFRFYLNLLKVEPVEIFENGFKPSAVKGSADNNFIFWSEIYNMKIKKNRKKWNCLIKTKNNKVWIRSTHFQSKGTGILAFKKLNQVLHHLKTLRNEAPDEQSSE